MSEHYYVRMHLQKWKENFYYESGLSGGAAVPFKGIKSIGFLEVFATLEDFKAIYSDEEPIMIREVE